MDISLKLGTDNFLKTQLTSADTLLKPLFDSKGDHLLIKELTTSGDYRSLKGGLNSSKDLYLLVYIKLNNEQISIFEDKVYYKFNEFVEKNNEPAIFQKRADFKEYLLINSFQNEEDLGFWKKQITDLIKNGIQAVSNEPLKFFSQAYQKEI